MEILDRRAFPDRPHEADRRPRKAVSAKPEPRYAALAVTLLACGVISALAGFGWVRYSDYMEENMPVARSLHPGQRFYIPQKAFIENEEAIKKQEQLATNPSSITSIYDCETYQRILLPTND